MRKEISYSFSVHLTVKDTATTKDVARDTATTPEAASSMTVAVAR